jgi:hypothetical protein
VKLGTSSLFGARLGSASRLLVLQSVAPSTKGTEPQRSAGVAPDAVHILCLLPTLESFSVATLPSTTSTNINNNNNNMTMYVKKRNGKSESVHFDKITSRIAKLCGGLDSKVRNLRTNDEDINPFCWTELTHLFSTNHSIWTLLSFLKKSFKVFTPVSPLWNWTSK